MNEPDIRWQQRCSNFQKALGQLGKAVSLSQQRSLSDLERQGLIQAFEYTYELGWNSLRDYLTYQGVAGIVGSRDTIREAFSLGLIADGEGWMEMLVDRNKTSHTYNEETAAEIMQKVCGGHFQLLSELGLKMAALGKS